MFHRTQVKFDDAVELDSLLCDFFQAELPSPWPDSPLAREEVPSTIPSHSQSSETTHPRSVVVRSRTAAPTSLQGGTTTTLHRVRRYFTLALTVGILVTGLWMLLETFPGTIEKQLPTPAFSNNVVIGGVPEGPEILDVLGSEPKKTTTIPADKTKDQNASVDLDTQLNNLGTSPNLTKPNLKNR